MMINIRAGALYVKTSLFVSSVHVKNFWCDILCNLLLTVIDGSPASGIDTSSDENTVNYREILFS